MIQIIFGLIQLFVGVYGLAATLKMRNKRIITGGYLPRAISATPCRDPEGLIRFLFKPQLAFSVYCVANGVVTILDEQYGILQGGLNVTLSLVFVVIAYWFSSIIRKAVRTYF